MARKPSLEQLQARKAQAQARLAREQQAVAALTRQAAQAKAAARRAHLVALGTVVETVYGAITPADLRALLHPLASVTIPGHETGKTTDVTAGRSAVQCTLDALTQVVQQGLSGHGDLDALTALLRPLESATLPGHDVGDTPHPAESRRDVLRTLASLARLVHDVGDGHLSPAVLTDVQRTLAPVPLPVHAGGHGAHPAALLTDVQRTLPLGAGTGHPDALAKEQTCTP